MTDKEKIRAEVERRLKLAKKNCIESGWDGYDAQVWVLDDMLSFIDSLPEEPTIEAEIVKDLHNLLHVKSGPLPMPSEYKFGDKVKIIIIKEGL